MKKIALCLSLVCFCGFLSAQSVTLDSTFGGMGRIATNMYDSYGNPYGSNVALMPNGEVVAIGVFIGSTNLPVIEKFGINGELDPNFTRVFTNLVDANLGVSSQLDGKILVTGIESVAPYHGSVSRINIDGEIDTTFGNAGFSSLLVGIADNIIPMELSNGKVVVFGDESDINGGITVVATRLHSNGMVDTTFGEGGYFRFGLTNEFLLISTGLEQPDGKLLFAGMADWKLFVIRLNPEGTIDLSFGTDGYLIDPMPNGGEAYSLDLQTDGKIVVCGYAKPSYLPIVARYHPDGSIDTTFGIQGIMEYSDIEKYTEGIGIKVLPNGKILTGISSFYANNFYLTQLLANGTRDTTFGINGVYEYVNTDFRARAMSLNENTIAVSGREESNSSLHKIVLVRFLLDLNVGTLNPNDPTEANLLVYPNPIAEQFNLKFGLLQPENVSISLFDLQGHQIQYFITNQSFEQGEHALSIQCPSHLPSGNYVLCVEVAGKKRASIQIIKS